MLISMMLQKLIQNLCHFIKEPKNIPLSTCSEHTQPWL